MMRPRHRATRAAIVAASLCLLVLGTVAFARRIAGTEPWLGVQWVQASAGVVALTVEPESPAEAAGLLPGDILQRMGGRRVRNAVDAAASPWTSPAGTDLSLDVLRGSQVLHLELRPAYRGSAPPLYAYLAVVGLAFLASGAFLALRWPTIRGGRVYAMLGAALFAHLTLSHTGRGDLPDWVIYWGDVLAGAIAPALLLHLAISVSRRTVPARRAGVWLAYAPAVGIALYTVWLVGLRGVLRSTRPVAAVERAERAELIFLTGAVLLAVAILARSYVRSPSALHRSQVRWMLWGLALGLCPFLGIYAVPWAFGAPVPEWADLSSFGMVLVPAAFTAALARYRLHDLDLLLRRGLSAGTLILFLAAVYAAAMGILRRLAVDLLLPRSVIGFLATVVVLLAYPKLWAWVRAGVDRAFYRKRYSYRATLLDWGRELSAELDLPSLLEGIQERVRNTLGVPVAVALVRTGPGSFEDLRSRGDRLRLHLDRALLEKIDRDPCVVVDAGTLPAVPDARYLFGMKVKGRICALLLTAERHEGDEPLSSEDRSLLATLATHAATAIEAARLVREVREHAEEVETLKSRQEQILESSGVGLLLLDAGGRVLACNRALEQIYGLPREQAIGRTMAEVFPLHTVRRIERELASVATGGEARIYRHTLVNRAGNRIVVNLAVSSARPETEEGARVVTFDDVTERVKLEEQVLRTERLASLGMLAAGVAHEVNTPLTGISSYTQMLLEDLASDDPRREVLLKIEEQSHRASSIANSLLNLVRPERAIFERLSLSDTVREVLRLLEPQIRGRGLTLETELDEDGPRVDGHKGKLQQVLLNLLLNARDAVDEGGRIRVATYARDGRAILEVTDDGMGISEDDLPRIFDPFFTTKGRGKGTGLGLSISHGIVREHNGELHVESVPGEVTRFRVELPVARDERALA
jgi:PAS domain S-box-containing protein